MLATAPSPYIVANTETRFTRYAIYYVPETDTPLAQFGRSWFGYDVETSKDIGHQSVYGLSPEFIKKITETPRHYGFHGTLKAPFRLEANQSLDDLKDQLACFATRRYSFTLGKLGLTRINNFLALCPTENTTRVDQLATQCVMGFEAFRAPLTNIERKRRYQSQLTTHQKLMVEFWGYPFVLSEFRFHMTLTGELSDYDLEQTIPSLTAALSSINDTPTEIRSICLLGEPRNGAPFELIARFPLSSGSLF